MIYELQSLTPFSNTRQNLNYDTLPKNTPFKWHSYLLSVEKVISSITMKGEQSNQTNVILKCDARYSS